MQGQRDPKFYNELKQTNTDLIDYLKRTHETSPHFDFTPTVNDYVSQINNLLKQYPEKPASTTITATTTTTTSQPFLFGAPISSSSSSSSSSSLAFGTAISSSSSTSTPAPLFSFGTANTFSQQQPQKKTDDSQATLVGIANGSAAGKVSQLPEPKLDNYKEPDSNRHTEKPVTTTSQPFLFGTPISSPPTSNLAFGTAISSSSSTLTPGSFFSFVPPTFASQQQKKEDFSANTSGDVNGDDEVHQPPEPKIDKYEEPDAKHSVKCKLYEREKGKDNDLSLTGIGILYVKALDTPNKQQVIIRQEPDLRRVLLNEVVTNNIPVKLLPKAVQIVFPGAAGDNKFYIVKVKDEAEANKLYDTLKMNKS